MTDNWMQKQAAKEWEGIDTATVAFAERMKREGRLYGTEPTSARTWLQGLRAVGLPTDLNADFDEPAMAAHLDKAVRASAYATVEKKKLGHITELRNALKIYALASAEGLRQRPLPPLAERHPRRFKTSHAEIRALLPLEDQQKLAKIEVIVRSLARTQWEGRGTGPFRDADGRTRHATISISTAEREINAVKSFLQHCHRKQWTPFTLAELLTPERICDFVYYGERHDGSYRTSGGSDNLCFNLVDFFYRGRVHHPDPVVVISDELQKLIDARVAFEKTRRHLHHARPASESNTGEAKWFPSLDQVEWAIDALQDQIAQADDRYRRGGITRRQYWLAVRDATLALVALYIMARVESLSTISVSHIPRDPRSGAVITYGGSTVVRGIVRAKTKDRRHYPFVPELIIPANALRHIRKLLDIEGRSLEQPLRPGESPVRLTAANRAKWGNTRLPSGEVVVVPLWRADPDSPKPLTYGHIRKILEDQLTALHFGSTNPHTLRATGAIYWTFVRGMPEEYVMRIGLWDSPEELRRSYAKIGSADRMRRMAAYIPLDAGTVPEVRKGEREQAAADGIGVLTQMLSRSHDDAEVELLVKKIHSQIERIERSIAAARGVPWTPPRLDRFQPGEVERLEDALRDKKHEHGISSVIGRDFWADEKLQREARAAAAEPKGLPARIQFLKTTIATRRPIEPRNLRRAA